MIRQGAPAPFRHLLFRLPLLLERAGLPAPKGLFGVEWIVLETVGRRTGRPHPVVLDVIARDPGADCYYVQPADAASDWVRNVRHQPVVMARVGARRFRARVRDATGSEGAEAMLHFVREHPWYARMVAWFLGHVPDFGRPDADLLGDFSALKTFAVDVAGDL
jgi:deazaflavin-dependent oxidoreductase (nitroreductase family)